MQAHAKYGEVAEVASAAFGESGILRKTRIKRLNQLNGYRKIAGKLLPYILIFKIYSIISTCGLAHGFKGNCNA